MSLVARGHLRGNQVETAHALSSESALKLGVGVMVWGDKSSETPARTAGSLYPNGGMLPAGETDKGLYFPPQNKRRDGLRLGPSQRLPPTRCGALGRLFSCTGAQAAFHLHCPGLPSATEEVAGEGTSAPVTEMTAASQLELGPHGIKSPGMLEHA